MSGLVSEVGLGRLLSKKQIVQRTVAYGVKEQNAYVAVLSRREITYFLCCIVGLLVTRWLHMLRTGGALINFVNSIQLNLRARLKIRHQSKIESLLMQFLRKQ